MSTQAPRYYAITLRRSLIGIPRQIRAVAESLGLTKRLRTVYRRICPDIAGEILKIKELVSVELVERKISAAEARRLRKPDPGFKIVGTMTAQGPLFFKPTTDGAKHNGSGQAI